MDLKLTCCDENFFISECAPLNLTRCALGQFGVEDDRRGYFVIGKPFARKCQQFLLFEPLTRT